MLGELGVTTKRPTVKRSTSFGVRHGLVEPGHRAQRRLQRVAPPPDRCGAGMRGRAADLDHEALRSLNPGHRADRNRGGLQHRSLLDMGLHIGRGRRRSRCAAAGPARRTRVRVSARPKEMPSASTASSNRSSGAAPENTIEPMQPGSKRLPSSLVQATSSMGRLRGGARRRRALPAPPARRSRHRCRRTGRRAAGCPCGCRSAPAPDRDRCPGAG